MSKKEYIEREAALKSISAGQGCGNICSQAINRIPAADVIEVKHGYWKWEKKIEARAQNRLYCSICDNECLSKNNFYVKSPYCPYCNAKMDEKGDSY